MFDVNNTNNMTVETKFATFEIAKTTNGIFESHCGYEKGCFYTEPAEMMYPLDTPLDKVTQDLISMYGQK